MSVKLSNLTTNSVVINISLNIDEWQAPDFDVSIENILLAITLTVIDVVTIFGNLLVLIAFFVDRRLFQPFNMFIFNLAVTDFLVAITAMTFYTIDTMLSYWPFGKMMCGVWIYFDFAMTFASVFTLVSISVDRFWCVTWALHYKIHNNRTKTAVILVIIWLCVVAIWTPPFIGDRLKHNELHFCIWEPSDNREFVIFVAVIGHYIPCFIMVFCYFKVLFVMRRQSARVATNLERPPSTAASNSRVGSTSVSMVIRSSVRHNTDNPGPAFIGQSNAAPQYESTPNNNVEGNSAGYAVNGRSSVSAREKKIFITLTYVLGSYLLCWFPFYIAFDTYAWKPELVPSKLYTFFFWMTYVNSALNPIIYAYTSKEFRQAFIKVLKLMYTCKT